MKKENWNIKWSFIKPKPKRSTVTSTVKWEYNYHKKTNFLLKLVPVALVYFPMLTYNFGHIWYPLLPVWLRRLVYNRIITMASVHQNSPNKQHRMASECFCQQRRHHGPRDTNDMSACESSSSGSVLASEYAICERGSFARLLSGIRQCLTSDMKF